MAFFTGLYDTFYNNIINGGQFLTILTGLRTTVVIALIGLAIGTAIGAALCAMSRSRFRALRAIDGIYTVIVRGTPVVMILMLLFYVVFTRMDAMVIAYLGFGISTGAHIGEIMKSALKTVDPGQISAARTLGFSRAGAFFSVTLPQAARIARSVYQNTVVNTIQWTSVVGYITVSDLSRVVNNMGARTAQPFFAMAVGIALYVVMAYVVHLIFRLFDRKEAKRA